MSSVAEQLVLLRVSDAIVALDRDWRYTYVNPQAAALFGRTPEDLLGKHIWTEFPEGVGQPFKLAYERAMAEQTPLAFEEWFAPWDRWFENRVYPSPDGLTIFFHEITDRKRSEQAEREANELNRQVIDSSREGIAVFDRELRYRRVNPALVAIMGAAPEALLGRRPRDVVPGPAAVEIEERLARALAGEVIETRDFTVRRVDRSGEAWISSLLSPLHDAEGTIVGVLAFIRDVTVRVRAEAATVESEQRLRLALDAAHAGIWDWDLATNTIVWSRGHEELWGMEPGSFRGTYAEFAAPVHPEDLPAIERAVQAALAADVEYVTEFRIRQPDGSERWIAGSGRALRVDGRAVRLLGTVVDVTARKRAELAVQIQTRVLERVASGATIDVSLAELVRGIEQLVPEIVCSVLLLDDERVRVRHVAAPSLPAAYVAAIDGQPIGPNAGSCGTAAFLGAAVHTEDITTDPRWASYRATALQHGLRSCWSTPIFDDRRRPVGTFALYGRAPGLPKPWHLQLITAATHVAEVVLEHDRARRELATSERRYQDLYENAPDMYLSVDLTTRKVVACNATLVRFTGFERGEVIGRDVVELFDASCANAAKSMYAELGRTGEVRDRALRIRRKDGGLIDISVNATVDREVHVPTSRSIWRDITRQVRAEEDLRRLSARVLRSQDDERRRIARELHDTTGQNLAALAMNLALVQRRTGGEVAELVEECMMLTTRSAAELRTLSYVLHPPLLEDFGLERALRELAEGFGRRAGLQISLEVPAPIGRFPPDRELALFRVAQESLANVQRHAESPDASIRLARSGDEIVLEIRDSGAARSVGERPIGVGIAGMRERLRQLGGRLDVTFGADGTMVRAVAPIDGAT